MNRPFASAAVAFAAGIAAGFMGPAWCKGVPAVPLILVALAAMALSLNRWLRSLALALIVFGGIAHHRSREAGGIPRHLLDAIASKPGLHQVRGIICSDPDTLPFNDFYDKTLTHRAVFDLDVREIKRLRTWVAAPGRVRVTVKTAGAVDLRYGDYIWLEGKFYRPRPPTNPGQFFYGWYLERRGIHLSCSARCRESFSILSRRAGSKIIGAAFSLRRRLAANVEAGMPGAEARRLLAAVLLGYREGIGHRLEQSFRKTNTVHILAISGLHVGLIYLLIASLLGIFTLPKWAVSLVAIPPLLLYAVLTGLKVPVLRATCMLVVYLMAPFFRREANLFNTVGFAAFLILFAAPAQLFDAGFQLSFAAVLSIIAFAPPLERALFWFFGVGALPGRMYAGPLGGWPARLGRATLSAASVSLAASIGLLPLIAFYFTIVSPVAIVANIVVAFLLAAAIGLGFLSAAAGCLWDAFSVWLNRLNYWIIEAMIRWVRLLAAAPAAYFRVRPPTPLEMCLYYTLLLLVLNRRRLTGKRLLAGACAVMVLFAVLRPPGGEDRRRLTIAFLDVGQGDSAFVQLPNRATMLIDGGPRTNFDSGRFVVIPFLRAIGVHRLDAVIATHADMDHIGGLLSVVDEMEVGRLIAPHARHTTWTQCRLLEMIGERGVPLHLGRRNGKVELCPGVSIDILHPTDDLALDNEVSENDRSVVVRLEYGGTSALFTGDIGADVEEELAGSAPDLRSDLLKVSHHGAKSGTCKDFLAGVRPRIAVISAGRDNRYGHPAPEVLKRLESMGATVYRTDRDGAVFLASDGDSWSCSVFCREPAPAGVVQPARN